MKNYVDYYVHFTETLAEINSAAIRDPGEMIAQMERLYERTIDSIAEFIIGGDSGNKLLMLAGPSGSGKTTTAAMLCKRINAHGVNAIRVSLDDFYLGGDNAPRDEFGEPDYECVEALDVPLMRKCLTDIVGNKPVVLPRFNFHTKEREKEGTELNLKGDNIIVVEGIHALNPVICNDLPDSKLLKVYCSVKQGIRAYRGNKRNVIGPYDMRLIRRIVRDNQFRSTTADATMNMWPSVRRGEEKYLSPHKGRADVTINSIHIYEPCVMAPLALPLLKEIPKSSQNYELAKKLIKKLDKFNPIELSLVPESSLLREFLGGSIY